MCEFCTKHGEGKKWYEVMEHYSRKCYGCGVCRAACKKEAISLWDKVKLTELEEWGKLKRK